MLSATDDFLRLLAEFPDLTQLTFSSSATKHGVDHHVATTGPPAYAQAQRLDPGKLTVAKAEFENRVHPVAVMTQRRLTDTQSHT